MVKLKELLLEDARQEFSSLINEGRLVARTSLWAGLNAADSAVRTMASSVAICSPSWLQSFGLPYEVQSTIQNLAFKGPSLVLDQMDSKLLGCRTLAPS